MPKASESNSHGSKSASGLEKSVKADGACPFASPPQTEKSDISNEISHPRSQTSAKAVAADGSNLTFGTSTKKAGPY